MTDSIDWNDDLLVELELLKAPKNWGEITGPFFHLQLPDSSPIGPFHAKKLKEFATNINFPPATMVRDAKGIGTWISFYEHPFFQRRKPQVVGDDNIEDAGESFFLLIEGSKLGPFTISEVRKMLAEKEALLTDHASLDGIHWQKLHQMNEFDRREHTQSSLPESPGWEIFKESNAETQASLDNPDIETGALASLAFLENVKSGKSPIKESDLQQNESSTKGEFQEAEVIPFSKDIEQKKQGPEEVKSSNGLQYGTYGLIAFLLMGSAFFFFNHNESAVKLADKQVTEDTSTNSSSSKLGRKAKDRTYRAPRLKAKVKPRSRRPASITDTDSFDEGSKRRLQDSAYEDSYPAEETNYYDEPSRNDEYDYDSGETPVQQDTIRKKLDKNIIDSQEDYYNEEERYEYDDTYGNNFGDAPQIEPEQVWGNDRVPAGQNIPDGEDAFPEEFAPEFDEEIY